MGALLKLFDNFYANGDIAPSSIKYDEFNINSIDKNFIVSKTLDNKTLSLYKENIWDFTPYISNPSQPTLLDFTKKIAKENIADIKKIMLLLMFFGSGKNNSQYSSSTLHHYFDDVLTPLSKYATKHNISIKKILQDNLYLMSFIDFSCTDRGKTQATISLLSFLNTQQNSITKISFQRDEKIFSFLKKLYYSYDDKLYQTELIPSRILFESIQQRWQQIDEIENNLYNILNLLEEYLSSDKYSEIIKTVKEKYKKFDDKIEWIDFIKRHKLEKLFAKYGVENRLTFKKFIIDIQGTSKHLILAYTGMRNGEVLNLKTDCLEKKILPDGVSRLISSTSKLSGRKQEAKWVTTKEIEKVIHILNSINKVIALYYQANIKDMPLFLSSELLLDKYKYSAKMLHPRRNFIPTNELKLNHDELKITAADKDEVQNIEFHRTSNDMEIGKIWRFKSHQYRRSLAVYSIQSGLVSLGALQIQLKHQFREMTLYYSNGASYAKQLFDVPKGHIAHDINNVKSDIDALVYIKDIIFSKEKLYGGHGTFIENNIHTQKDSLQIYLLKNREKTIKQFKNGDIAYTTTALGACVSTDPCNAILNRSFVACGSCDKSIIKQSKLDNVIQKQKEFINFLDKDSIEYRTEVRDLEELEKQRKLFLEAKI